MATFIIVGFLVLAGFGFYSEWKETRGMDRDEVRAWRARNYGPKTPKPGPQLARGKDGIYCPRCKGTQFKARRTAGQRTMIGTAGVLTGGLGAAASARKRGQKVQCVTCGTFYDRIPV